MNLADWFYSETDIARRIISGNVSAKAQHGFLRWLQEKEGLFLPLDWFVGDDGFRAMFLAVQNAVSYLMDRDSFDVERQSVEKEGGALPSEGFEPRTIRFLKDVRLELSLADFLGRQSSGCKRMKCKTILERCGISRRTEAFCREFELAAAFYHIGLRRAGKTEDSFSIAGIPFSDNLFLTLL